MAAKKGGKSKSPKKSPGGSPKKSKSPAKGKKGKGKKSKATEEPVQVVVKEEIQEKKEVPEPPPGVVPLFFTTQTQQIFNILADVEVTRESPNAFLSKMNILEDIKKRKAISDFSPINELILEYPSDEVLVVYDADFRYGENFFVCVTEDAKENTLFPPDEEEEEEDPFALPDIPYIPPEPKEWQSLGSELEVVSEKVFDSRPKLQLSVMKPRRHFAQKCVFSNRDADSGKDTYQECLPNYERRNNVCQRELDKGTQAVPSGHVITVQTDYRKPLRQWSQYVPRELTEEDKGDMLESEHMGQFVKAAIPVLEGALQQNEIVDFFRNDWEKLNPGKSVMTERQETYLKEYQSFQDLHYSKEKQIICDDWHTTIPGLVGVSCVEQMSFDVRVRNMSRIMMVPSLVLLWNYQDPIHPRLLLESPDDCFVFRFNPVNPNIVAGGCMSGLIVVWDLTQYYGRLAMTESAIQMKKLAFLSGLVEDTEGQIPIVQPVAKTNIDFGHSTCVTDLHWLLPPYVIDKQGRILKEDPKLDEECHQLISCAGDDDFLVWDITVQNTRKGHMEVTPDVGSTTVSHWQILDHNWRPVIRIHLPYRDDGTSYSMCRFRVRNVVKDSREDEDGDEEDHAEKGAPETPDDAVKCPLSIYAATQTGEALFMDLRVKKDSDSNRLVVSNFEQQQVHAGPVRSVCISPFFDDMVLTVGGFRFAIWKTNIKLEPLIMSAEAPARRSSGAWSLTRPTVFFIGRQDGAIEVWDMMDRAQEPMLMQSLSGVEVTSLNLRKLGRRQVLSVSDNSGNLHLLEIPPILSQAEGDELHMLEKFFHRESRRHEIKLEREADSEKKAAGQPAAPPPPQPAAQAEKPAAQEAAELNQVADEEYEEKAMYEAYLGIERKLVNQLDGREETEVDASAS